MTRGFLYYAHNNEAINYLKLAICSALTGKYFSNEFQATVITDEVSIKSLNKQEKKTLEKCFEKIKINNKVWKEKNEKQVLNVFENKGIHSWWNKSRPSAYMDSDYNETVLVDVDYVFQDSNIDKVWNSKSPIMINDDVLSLSRNSDKHHYITPQEKYVGNFTIPLRWATMTYFNRSKFAEDFFMFANYVKDNWIAICRVYNIIHSMYRNDYAFSIALYMANGFCEPTEEFNLPFKYVLATHEAKIHQVNLGLTRFIYHAHNWKVPWLYTNVQDISYHCMNKVSMLENYGTFVEFYGRDI